VTFVPFTSKNSAFDDRFTSYNNHVIQPGISLGAMQFCVVCNISLCNVYTL
jgi:hypothetical protein